MNQFGTVVDGNNLHPSRQPRLDLLQFCLNAIDDFERILSAAHHYDSRNDFSCTIQVCNSPAQVGSNRYITDIFDSNRRSALGNRYDNILEVIERSGISSPSNHVFRAAELE